MASNKEKKTECLIRNIFLVMEGKSKTLISVKKRKCLKYSNIPQSIVHDSGLHSNILRHT